MPNDVIFYVWRKNHIKILSDSLRTVEISSVLNSKPTNMSLATLCVWAPSNMNAHEKASFKLTYALRSSSVPFACGHTKQRSTSRNNITKVTLELNNIAKVVVYLIRQKFSIFRSRQSWTHHRNACFISLVDIAISFTTLSSFNSKSVGRNKSIN